jgi:hypothetical protein
MHIGELAHKATVNIQTIRFYEREGLLPPPARNDSGYRCYDAGDLDRVTFIKRNQELGFTLEEIKQLLDLHRVVAAMTFPLRHKPTELFLDNSGWPTIPEPYVVGSNRNSECGHFPRVRIGHQLSLPPSEGNPVRYARGGDIPQR